MSLFKVVSVGDSVAVSCVAGEFTSVLSVLSVAVSAALLHAVIDKPTNRMPNRSFIKILLVCDNQCHVSVNKNAATYARCAKKGGECFPPLCGIICIKKEAQNIISAEPCVAQF